MTGTIPPFADLPDPARAQFVEIEGFTMKTSLDALQELDAEMVAAAPTPAPAVAGRSAINSDGRRHNSAGNVTGCASCWKLSSPSLLIGISGNCSKC
jgi:hypothetical protein